MLNEDFVDTTPARSREFVYNDIVYVFTATDPYGMWTIKNKQGTTAEMLKGQYTSLSEAERAVVVFNAVRATKVEEFNKANTKEPKALAAAKRHADYMKLKEELDSAKKD